MRVWSLGWEGPLEKEMATRSTSCLKKPMDRGGLQFMGSQRVEHDWARTHAHCSSKEEERIHPQVPSLGSISVLPKLLPVAVCREPLPGWNGSVGSPPSQGLLMFSCGEPRPLRQLPTVWPCSTREGNFLFPQADSSSHIQICSSRSKCWWPVISGAPRAECVPKAWVLTCCSPLAKTTLCKEHS